MLLRTVEKSTQRRDARKSIRESFRLQCRTVNTIRSTVQSNSVVKLTRTAELFRVKIEWYYTNSCELRPCDAATIRRAQNIRNTNGLDEASDDPPLSRLLRLREAPASSDESGVWCAGCGGGTSRAGPGEHDNRADVFAVLRLARSAHQDAFFISYRVHYL